MLCTVSRFPPICWHTLWHHLGVREHAQRWHWNCCYLWEREDKKEVAETIHITQPCSILPWKAPHLGGERKYASWQKYLWFSFLKQILSMQVPLWRKTAISSCTEFVDKKFHAHLWESHCKDLFLYEMIMREPLQRFIFIWNIFFLGFWSLQNFLWSYQWMDAGKRKWLSPET